MNIADRMESFRYSYRKMLRELVLQGLSISHDSAYTDVLVENEIDKLEAKLNPIQAEPDMPELLGLPVIFVGENGIKIPVLTDQPSLLFRSLIREGLWE